MSIPGMSIWERVKSALSSLSISVVQSVYVPVTGGNYPDAFIVYFLVNAPPDQHADNVEKLTEYEVQVSFYNKAGLANMPDIDGMMKAAGFTAGNRTELPYNQATRHFGLAMEFSYLEERI
jgi:hypothetical protein